MSKKIRAYIRHGIFSSPENMIPLTATISGLLPNCETNNEGYVDYKETILYNGIALAEIILREFSVCKAKGELCDIILIGHSQGGLLCRVAAATICATQQLEQAIRTKTCYINRTSKEKCLDKLEFLSGPNFKYAPTTDSCDKHIVGVVTLATPNAGAVTNAQLSLLGRSVKKLMGRVFSGLSGQKTIDELTTGSLFRVLQHVRVEGVKYLSISGSLVNRYSFFNQDDFKIAALGPHFELPNDGIVEDASVDLRESPLPCEIKDMDQQYTHVRSYTDCLDISHTAIHSRPEVTYEMGKVFKSWGLIT